MIYKNMRQLIGNTPIVFYRNVNNNAIYLKLEQFNPAGSVKDRIALSMVNDLLDKGLLNEQSHVVEATSGNTGIGLAFVLATLNIRLTIVMPSSASKERIDLMQAYGAQVILTPGELSMKGAKEKAQQLAHEHGYLYLEQFSNPKNPEAHMKTTANEIIADFEQLDYIVAGVGTGGTITGLGKILKKHYENLKMVAVEPDESAVLSGDAPGSHRIAGIGAGFIPPILDRTQIDEIIRISSSEAITKTKELARLGFFFGISSGAAILASEQLAKRIQNSRILVIIPDGGIKYMSQGVYQ